MKKLTLFLGAVVLGFMLVSCGNKKDQVIKVINDYYDNEIVELNKVDNLNALLEYRDASDERAEALNKVWFPQDETADDPLKDLSEEELETVYSVIDDRWDELDDLFDTKASGFYEPIISDLEASYNELVELVEPYEDAEAVPDELFDPVYEKFLEKYELAMDHRDLANHDQFDRLYVFIQKLEDEEDAREYKHEKLHF